MTDVAVIVFSQLAEQYGTDVAEQIVNRSRSDLKLDLMQKMPYSEPSPSSYHARYDSVGTRAPEGLS